VSGERWFEALGPIAREACLTVRPPYPVDVVLFYLARWCQKESRQDRPDTVSLDRAQLRESAEKIARNLTADGATIERLLAGDRDAITELRRELLASAVRGGGGGQADEYADEARQKVLEVLLTGTRPSRAIEELEHGPEGPGNEYVFVSPFSFWARSVVKNLVTDAQRKLARERQGPPSPPPRKPPALDRELLRRAHHALPDLLAAIRELPPAQRAAMAASLGRHDLDELVRDRLHELAPDLFSELGPRRFSSDDEIAEHLGSTARRVASNRSEARRRLSDSDPLWELLLDSLLPHRSTRGARRARKRKDPRAASSAARLEG
jgi:DNA-directed RNA polymerase specialized sigma24 family protein